jgi:hypothetical protein
VEAETIIKVVDGVDKNTGEQGKEKKKGKGRDKASEEHAVRQVAQLGWGDEDIGDGVDGALGGGAQVSAQGMSAQGGMTGVIDDLVVGGVGPLVWGDTDTVDEGGWVEVPKKGERKTKAKGEKKGGKTKGLTATGKEKSRGKEAGNATKEGKEGNSTPLTSAPSRPTIVKPIRITKPAPETHGLTLAVGVKGKDKTRGAAHGVGAGTGAGTGAGANAGAHGAHGAAVAAAAVAAAHGAAGGGTSPAIVMRVQTSEDLLASPLANVVKKFGGGGDATPIAAATPKQNVAAAFEKVSLSIYSLGSACGVGSVAS